MFQKANVVEDNKEKLDMRLVAYVHVKFLSTSAKSAQTGTQTSVLRTDQVKHEVMTFQNT